MTSSEHVLCCVVNDVMQHLMTLGSVTPEPSPYRREAENNAELSGVIVRVAGITSAAIGFHHDPDSTQSLVLSEPVFVSDAAPETSRAWLRQMLSAVIAHAQQTEMAQIRFLEWESHCDPELMIASELKLAQFSALASVVGWKATAEECLLKASRVATVRLSIADLHALSDSPQSESSPQFRPAMNTSTAQQRHREIAVALDRILENTDDLASLDAPTGNDLLRKWSSQECTLLVAETETGVAGLCAFAFKPCSDGDSAAAGQIEYLGVRKEMQRQGIATQMLSYLCRGVSRGSTQMINITAFADETNAPANAFYRQSGFKLLCRGRLWYRDASLHLKQKEPS
ncbi:MAG: GNAT family N-acetyltransferase [Planctomycetaceae bacterium]